MTYLDPNKFVITRKRKKYKFALFANSPLCFEVEQWNKTMPINTLEMGAGTALFSIELARTFPGKQFVACDVKADRLQSGAQQAEKEQLNNVRFLRVRADQLKDLIMPGSLESIWVTFPDPFPKSRSAKHRLTHPQFLSVYGQLLGEQGALYVKTDATALFEWSLEQLVATGWKIEELSFDLHESNLSEVYKIMTTYEARFMSQGFRTQFVKAIPPV